MIHMLELPNLGLPISDGIVDHIIAGDLNPAAAELLEKNLQVLKSKFSNFTYKAICADALEWLKTQATAIKRMFCLQISPFHS